MEIVTERLRLRNARMADVEAMDGILSNPQAMTYWSSLPHESLDQTRQWVASMVTAVETGPSFDFIIERDGETIGKAGFWKPPEIGYILHPGQWGQGLAREALEAVIRVAFGVMDLPAIEADVDPRNLASIGLLERLGFQKTGYGKDT